MKRARKTFKAILAVLLVGVVLSVSSWAFAQAGGISGSVKDISNNQGIQGVIITVKDVSTSALAETGNTDALGNYSVSIPSLGNYTLLASKLGYDNMMAPDVIELSDMSPNRTVNISMGGKAWLKEKPVETTEALSWETGAGKSYLLNGYDRLVYDNEVEGGGKSTTRTCRSSGIMPSTAPGGLTRTTSPRTSSSIFMRDPSTTDSHDHPTSITGSPSLRLHRIKALPGSPLLQALPKRPSRFCLGRLAPARATLSLRLRSRASSSFSTGTTGSLTPTRLRGGKKSTTRTCRPSGIMPSTAPGGLTRTTSPRTSSSILIRDPSTTDLHDQPASASGSPPPIPSRAVFSGRRPVRPRHLPSMTRSPAALPAAFSGSHSSGWPAWFSKAMAASLSSGVSSAQQ